MNQPKILVVDDDKEIVGAIKKRLEMEDYEIITAYDGLEAMDILMEQEVQLLIIDVMMPKMDGLSATMKIRESKNIPIIILSAKTEESDKISTLRANGLLDADICAARMNAISARLAQLRGERRRLTENEAIDETMDALRKVEQTLLNGPERLDGFDEELFEHLVEKIIAESQNRIRFRLYGGLELTEQWEVAAR